MDRPILASAAAALFLACAGLPEEPHFSAAASPLIDTSDALERGTMDTYGHPGWTAGSFGVSDHGSAQGTVPIRVAPGRRGIEPELRLAYETRSGDGLLGTGWSLQGLSRITRCDRSRLVDGQRRPVRFDDEDALCMDGARLVALRDGDPAFYGGGQYRAHRNGYAKIERRGPLGELGTIFRVSQRDGLIRTYGQATAHLTGPRMRADAAGATSARADVTHAWLLSRVEDRFGNFMTFQYDTLRHPDGSVESLPVEIRYTGHESLDDGRRRVRFVYGPRAEGTGEVIRWEGGLGRRRTQQLERIEVYAPQVPGGASELLRTYRLGYRSPTEHLLTNRLAEVAECDAAGVCREALRFSYRYADVGPDRLERTFTPFYGAYYSGDSSEPLARSVRAGPNLAGAPGAMLFRYELHNWVVSRRDPEGTWRDEPVFGAWDDQRNTLIPFDYDGDGRGELLDLHARVRGGRTVIDARLRSVDVGLEGDAYAYRVTQEESARVASDPAKLRMLLADMDGDGRTDLVVQSRNAGASGRSRWQIFYTVAPGGLERAPRDPMAPDLAPTSEHNVPVGIGDVDGDGAQDLIAPREDTGTYWVQGVGPERRPKEAFDTGIAVTGRVVFLDLNGDGLTDMLDTGEARRHRGGGPFRARINLGGSFAAPYDAKLPGRTPRWDTHGNRGAAIVHVVDLNRDGRDDFVAHLGARHQRDQEPDIMTAYLSDGRRFRELLLGPGGTSLEYFDSRHALYETIPTRELDADGDGMPDLVFPRFFRCGDVLRPECPEGADTEGDAWIRYNPFAAGEGELLEVHVGEHRLTSYEYDLVRGLPDPADACQENQDCAAAGVRVVSAHTDRLGRRFRHQYRDARADLRSGASLGFAEHYIVNTGTGRIEARFFDVEGDVPGAGYAYASPPRLIQTWAQVGDRFRLSETESRYEVAWPHPRHYFVQLGRSESRTWETRALPGGFCGGTPGRLDEGALSCRRVRLPEGAELLRKRIVDLDYDATGEVEASLDAIEGGELRRTLRTLEHRPGDYLLGLVRRSETTATIQVRGRLESATRVTSAAYDAEGFAFERVRAPRQPGLELVTTRDRDAFGLLAKESRSAAGEAVREVALTRDPNEHIFVHTFTNAEGHRYESWSHPGFGLPLLVVGPNGLSRAWRYDGFGRLRQLEDDRGMTLRLLHRSTGGRARMRVRRNLRGHDLRFLEVDHLGRAHRIERAQPGGLAITELHYDAQGRLRETFGPHLEGETRGLRRTYHYDAWDRPTRVEHHDREPDLRIAYEGLRTILTDRRGHERVLQRDPAGRPVFSELAGLQTMRRELGPFGVERFVVGQDGVTWERRYDAFGRRVEDRDPDVGIRQLEYSAFDLLSCVRDGSGAELVRYEYDRLGRLLARRSPEDGVASFVWDTAARGIGQLHTATAEGDGVSETRAYDSRGRIHRIDSMIGRETLTYRQTFGNHARIRTQRYPGGLVVQHHYAAERESGLLRAVEDRDSGILWEAAAWDAFGAVARERYGNGVEVTRERSPETGRLRTVRSEGAAIWQTIGYDASGNPTLRIDHRQGRRERFVYDPAERLESWSLGEEARRYAYDGAGNRTLHASVALGYGERGHGPHQVTSRGAQTFDYDGRGRRRSGPGFEITAYSSLGMPRSMEVARAEGNERVDFRYDAFGARREVREPGRVTTHLAGLFRRSEGAAGRREVATVHVHGRPIAESVRAEDGTRSLRFFHTGAQRSLLSMTDGRGGVLARFAYDPFGARRGGDATAWGFTAQEHLAGSNLVHMRSRFYDASLGAFLTPDPLRKTPLRRAALHPYAFGEQSPLRYVDPTGALLIDSGADGGSSEWGAAGGLAAGAFAAFANWAFGGGGRSERQGSESEFPWQTNPPRRARQRGPARLRNPAVSVGGSPQVQTQMSWATSEPQQTSWVAGMSWAIELHDEETAAPATRYLLHDEQGESAIVVRDWLRYRPAPVIDLRPGAANSIGARAPDVFPMPSGYSPYITLEEMQSEGETLRSGVLAPTAYMSLLAAGASSEDAMQGARTMQVAESFVVTPYQTPGTGGFVNHHPSNLRGGAPYQGRSARGDVQPWLSPERRYSIHELSQRYRTGPDAR